MAGCFRRRRRILADGTCALGLNSAIDLFRWLFNGNVNVDSDPNRLPTGYKKPSSSWRF